MKRSTCPKCGYVLRLRDWREECPQCGVNMTYYNKEETLLQDADRAEIEFALFQPHMDRAKASFIGSPFTIARLVCSLLPAGALFLPLAKLQYTPLLENESVTFTVSQLIEVLQYRQWDRIFGALPGILPIALPLFGALLCLILHLVGILGGCTKKGKIFLFTADAVALLLTGYSVWMLQGFVQTMSEALPQYIVPVLSAAVLSFARAVLFGSLPLTLSLLLYTGLYALMTIGWRFGRDGRFLRDVRKQTDLDPDGWNPEHQRHGSDEQLYVYRRDALGSEEDFHQDSHCQ